MGLMDNPAAGGRLIVTPHPVLVDGQLNQPADLRPGESLYAFLMRHVEDLDGRAWQVTIGGRDVPRHLWHHVRPKHGQVIEARGAVGRSAVALVAMVALTYFTMGAGAGWIAGTFGVAAGGVGAAVIGAGLFMAGSVLINKVLQPKQQKASASAPTVYSISAGRNRARAYEPLGLLFGSMRIAPDLASTYYTHYEGDDQFLSVVLTPGINVDSVEALYNGDALLSSYEGVRVWHNGFPGMPSQDIPLYSNADVVDGGTLLDTSNDPKHQPSAWVQRTSSDSTIRLMVGVEFQIWDRTTKGKDKLNQDQIQIQYRAVGATAWQAFGTFNVRGTTNKSQRASYAIDVGEGQYDVRVRVVGNNTDGSGAQASFVWTTLTSVQRDTATYAGIPRIGVRMQANGQLNGAPDEIRCVAHSLPIPVWKGEAIGWVTERTSNPGAQILAYGRGIYAPDGTLLAGMALPDRQIDVEGLKAFTLHCAVNGFTYDNWITDVRSHQQVLDVLALAGFGQISWPRGRLSVGWAADEQPLSGVVNMATIKKGQFQVDYTLANAADGIEYTYLDRTTWEAKTLRVPAPGVTTMLNPAQVTGEGVTTEAHAVILARWHLAQSLYQYKAISYSTDIEHLSYSRMSMLALQHDMTQWGYGGRVMSAAVVGGRMTLQLDEPVPASPQGSAFIGLRIPGERVYRVLKVSPFTGTSKEVTLDEAWPSDARVPGQGYSRPDGSWEDNAAWDTTWIYDFKQTPGLRVRVTGIRPESDLKGAAVEVVAESAEFWQYVKTGTYVPSPNESLLNTRPVASDLKVTERQVVQGDTEYTELQATFAVSGPVGDTVVLSDVDGNGELEQVGRTVTRTASWRVPGAGTYPITVRPYSPGGNAGVAVSLIYTTLGADAPPVLVDLFDVEQLSGGVRRYTWGFFADTIQSANFAGVEIRYIAGAVSQPDWEAMTPLGDDGYHLAAFEAVLPEAGVWTFACRSRNTSGTLSDGMQVATKNLTANLGEVIGGIEESLDEQIQKQIDQQQQIDRDRADSIARDAAEAAQRASDFAQAQVDIVNEAALRTAAVKQVADNLTAETNARAQAVQQVADDVVAVAEAVEEEAAARIQGLLNAKLEWKADIAVETIARESEVESLAQQIATVSAGSGTQFDNKIIWYFDNSNDGWWNNESTAATSVEGWLRPSDGAGIRWLRSVNNLGIDSTRYRFVKLRVRKVGNLTWRGRLSWVGTSQTGITEARSMYIPEPVWNENGIATVDYDNIPWTEDELRIVQLEAFTTSTATDYWAIDWFAIGRPSPGAGVALVQQETLARQAGDTAEATQRNALAVQLRGNYGGDDAAAAQGMIGQVNSARIEGDRIISERTSVVEARMPAGTGKVASEASVTAVEQASVERDNVNAEAITVLNTTLPALAAQGANMVINGGWVYGREVGWSYTSNKAGTSVVAEGRAGDCWRADGAAGTRGAYVNGGANVDVTPGLTYRVSCWYKTTADYNGTSNNGKMRLGNQTGGQIGSNTFGAGRADWTYLERVYTVPADGSITAFRLNILADHSVGTLWVDDVAIEEVTEVLANAQATQGLTTAVTNLEGTVASHGSALTQIRSDVDSKASAAALQELATEVTQHGNTLASQAGQLTQLQSGVSSAQQAAQDAATAAGAKGKVLYQSAAPAVADRLPQNLWIDTTGGSNTPKRWTGTAWLAVTDKVATDAAAAAAAAQATSSANAAAITATNTRVTQAEGSISSHGSSINQLTNSIQALSSNFNAIPNGGFDEGTSSWAAVGTGSSFSWDEAEKALRSGPGSIRVANITSISINPGDTITVTFRTKSSNDILSTETVNVGLIASLDRPVSWVKNWTNWINTIGGEWVDQSYTWEVPDTFVPQQVYLRFAAGYIRPVESAYVLIDDVVVQTPGSIGDLQNRVAANAQALSGLSTEVTQQGGTIASMGTSVNQLQNDVAGKASAGALQALDSRVVVAEGKVDSQAAAMTQVQSQLGNIGGDNLLGNSGFENGTDGWNVGNANPGTSGSRVIVDSSLPNSTKAWRWNMENYPANGYLECISNGSLQTARVEAGKRVVLSVYVRGTIGPRVLLQLAWYGETGGVISYSSSPSADPYRVMSEDWERKVWVSAVAPAGARSVRAYVRVYGTNTPDQWFELDNVQLQVGEVATGYSPSANELSSSVAANAAATTGLTTKMTSLEGFVASQGTALTQAQASLSGLFAQGENLLYNSNFATDLSWWTPAGSPWPAWSATAGDGRPGITMTKGNPSNPAITANEGRDIPIIPRAGRRIRAVVRAMGVSGAFNLMARLTRINTTTGNSASQDVQITVTEVFANYAVDFTELADNIGAIQFRLYCFPNNASVRVDKVELYDITDQVASEANASATSTLDGKVTSIGGTVTAQGQAITAVTATAGAADTKAQAAQAAAQAAADAAGAKGKVLYQSATPAAADRLTQNLWIDTTGGANTPKRWSGSAWVAVTDKAATDAAAAAAAAKSTADATASGLSATNAKVVNLEGTVAAHTTQINQAQASIAGKADSSALIQLEAHVSDSIGGSGNLIPNTTFGDGTTGWVWGWNDQDYWLGPFINLETNQYWPHGTNSMAIRYGGTQAPAGQTRFGYIRNRVAVAVEPGKRYCSSVFLNPYRCAVRAFLTFYDESNQIISEHIGELIQAKDLDFPTLATMPRGYVAVVAPSNARLATMGWRAEVVGGVHTNPYLWAVRPMLEEMREGQQGPSPWSAGGTEAFASASLLTDVNGNISGIQNKNDGTTGEINMLANVLNVLSPGAVDGLELRDGYLRVWRGNVQRIVGNGFGPDALMDYFGPNVGAGNASKAIATMWMDIFGSAYWGGTLSAGIYKNANRTSSTAPTPYVEVGPFATFGKSRNVVISFSTTSITYTTYFNNRPANNPPPPPTASGNSICRLQRSFNNEAWQLVNQQSYGVSAVETSATYVPIDAFDPQLPQGGWMQRWNFNCSGSFTVTEPAASSSNLRYEGAIIAQGINQISSQTLSVVCTEEP